MTVFQISNNPNNSAFINHDNEASNSALVDFAPRVQIFTFLTRAYKMLQFESNIHDLKHA